MHAVPFDVFGALRCAARGPSAERKECYFSFTRHLFLSAQARLGNVTGLLSDVPGGTGPFSFGGAGAL